MDKSLLVCLLTSGGLERNRTRSAKQPARKILTSWVVQEKDESHNYFWVTFAHQTQPIQSPTDLSIQTDLWWSCLIDVQFTKSGLLGPVAIICNVRLFLSPNDSTQRSILCGLLIQVYKWNYEMLTCTSGLFEIDTWSLTQQSILRRDWCYTCLRLSPTLKVYKWQIAGSNNDRTGLHSGNLLHLLLQNHPHPLPWQGQYTSESIFWKRPICSPH